MAIFKFTRIILVADNINIQNGATIIGQFLVVAAAQPVTFGIFTQDNPVSVLKTPIGTGLSAFVYLFVIKAIQHPGPFRPVIQIVSIFNTAFHTAFVHIVTIKRGVRAFVNGPEKRLVVIPAPTIGVPALGPQKTGLSFFPGWIKKVRGVQNRHISGPHGCMSGSPFAVRFNFYFLPGNLPVRFITIAGGQRGLIDGICFFTDLFNQISP